MAWASFSFQRNPAGRPESPHAHSFEDVLPLFAYYTFPFVTPFLRSPFLLFYLLFFFFVLRLPKSFESLEVHNLKWVDSLPNFKVALFNIVNKDHLRNNEKVKIEQYVFIKMLGFQSVCRFVFTIDAQMKGHIFPICVYTIQYTLEVFLPRLHFIKFRFGVKKFISYTLFFFL